MENWFFWIFEKIFKIFFVSFIWNLLWKFEKWHKITITKKNQKISKFFFSKNDSNLLSLIINLPWKIAFFGFWKKIFKKITITDMKFTMKNRKMIQNYYQKKKIKKFRKFFFSKNDSRYCQRQQTYHNRQ